MDRRNFIAATGSAGLAAAPLSAAPEGNAILELRWFRLRNGSQVSRTTDFLGRHFAPAARRAGVGPLGFFNAVIAEQAPFVLALTSYPSMQAVLEAAGRMAADKDFQKGFDEYNSMSEPAYIRMETALLRAFDVQKTVVPPPAQKAPRIFEMRTYESSNAKAGKTKIRMFDEGEAQLFRRLGMAPVFFAESIAGRNLPNLTYMLSFDDLASREKKWDAFRTDPEWLRMRAIPEYADALIVSNITSVILRGLPFSDIK